MVTKKPKKNPQILGNFIVKIVTIIRLINVIIQDTNPHVNI